MEVRRVVMTGLLSVLVFVGPIQAHTESPPPVIAPEDASKYVGKAVTVEGVVAQVSASGRGTTLINFGAAHPNEVFSAVIFKTARSQFTTDPWSWTGKRLRVTGTVRLNQTKPEMELAAPSQVQVLESK
jgi:DNA/RNA endonuclease YhcR with UshA esterase domain